MEALFRYHHMVEQVSLLVTLKQIAHLTVLTLLALRLVLKLKV